MKDRLDILYSGARFFTGRSESEAFGFLGVKDGRIALLSNARPREGTYRREVSLSGANAYPCMIDAHVHLLYTITLAALSLDVCQLVDGKMLPDTLAGVKAKLCAACANKKPGEVLIANNFIAEAIAEHRLPNRFELDEWCGGRPAIVYNIDGHSSALSTALLERAGIDYSKNDGVLRGREHEFNQGRITDCLGSLFTLPLIAKGVANFQNTCAAYGLSHVCALDGAGDTKDDRLTILLANIASRMQVGVRLYPQFMDLTRAAAFDRFMTRPRVGGCMDWELDGSMSSRSAAYTVPYLDAEGNGELYYETDALRAKVAEADAAGRQIAAHAIGDRAIAQILRIYKELDSATPHRIEHFEFPSLQSVDAIKGSNIAITVQPGFAWMDKRYLGGYARALPEATRSLIVPLKTLVEAGVTVCGSSDSPVQSVDPFFQMRGMVEYYRPDESLSVFQAFQTYTAAPARVLGEEADIGSLEVGKRANFFTLDKELFSLRPHELEGLRVKQTYLSGKPYKRKKGSLIAFAAMLLGRRHRI